MILIPPFMLAAARELFIRPWCVMRRYMYIYVPLYTCDAARWNFYGSERGLLIFWEDRPEVRQLSIFLCRRDERTYYIDVPLLRGRDEKDRCLLLRMPGLLGISWPFFLLCWLFLDGLEKENERCQSKAQVNSWSRDVFRCESGECFFFSCFFITSASRTKSSLYF